MEDVYLSVVVPIFNEQENVKELHRRILDVCKSFNKPFEIIFVNDGSTDNTLEELTKLTPLKIINFRKNFGQTAALDAGIKLATGERIATLDGDLQNYPEDIPMLLKSMSENAYDIVSGWRFNRKDKKMKRFVSRGANFLRKFIVNDGVHDSGCTLKVYKGECFENLDLFGEMHRFIPALLRWRGFKVGEEKVRHDPRIYGETKYNWKRMIKGFLDMLGIWFWHKYSNRPLHMFGTLGLLLVIFGSSTLIILFVLRLFEIISLTGKVWPLIAVFSILMGVQFFVTGLLADISIKNYYKGKNNSPYHVKDVRNQ